MMSYALDYNAATRHADHPCHWDDMLEMIETHGTAALDAISIYLEADTARERAMGANPSPLRPSMRALLSMLSGDSRGIIASLHTFLIGMNRDPEGTRMALAITTAAWNAQSHEANMERHTRTARLAFIAGTEDR